LLQNVEDMPDIQDSLSDIAITVQDVHEALVSLDVQKSPGMDRLSPRIHKKTVLMLYVSHFIICLLNHFVTLLCLFVGKFIKLYLSLNDPNCVKN